MYSICEYLEIPSKDFEKASKKIHNALKECFEIRSFADLSTSEFEKIASIVRVYFAKHHAWLIPEPDEEGFDPNKATLHELLKFKKIIK